MRLAIKYTIVAAFVLSAGLICSMARADEVMEVTASTITTDVATYVGDFDTSAISVGDQVEDNAQDGDYSLTDSTSNMTVPYDYAQ